MHYLSKEELRRLFGVARQRNRTHHLALLVGLWHGTRISETLAVKGTDIQDGLLSVSRLKGSKPTIHALHVDNDPLFDETPLIELARQKGSERLFPFSRQRVDEFMKNYAALAGIHPSKAHYHALKHSICMLIWDDTRSLSAIQQYVGHKSPSSTLIYLAEADNRKAASTVARMSI